MEPQGFADKLLPKLSLDEMEFACDLERVLAEQVKYLREVLISVAGERLTERDEVISELRARIAEKDAEISRLRAENRELLERMFGLSA